MGPELHYAKSGDIHIAYQTIGDGPLDLVYVPGWVSNVEEIWEEPTRPSILRAARLVLATDPLRQAGYRPPDPVPTPDLPSLEERMDDLRAVMDAAGSERAALLGHSEGGVMSVLFAATYPERTSALITLGTFAKRIWSEDYPWAPTPEQRELDYAAIERDLGTSPRPRDLRAVDDRRPRVRLMVMGYLRRSASPQAALALLKMNTQADIRQVLGAVNVPSLIMNRVGDLDVNVEEARYIAAHIPGARFVELPGGDHLMWVGETEPLLDEIEEFLTGVRSGSQPDRVLATVLFTDIVGSTERAAALGDHAWGELLERHHAAVRTEFGRFRGHEVSTAGDGFFATFDGPARAIRCARAMTGAVRDLGLQIRAGLHTGEVDRIDGEAGGIAVNIGARVSSLAGPSEVLVSQTVKDLVAGSGIAFEDAGEHELKGVPDRWHLYRVVDPG